MEDAQIVILKSVRYHLDPHHAQPMPSGLQIYPLQPRHQRVFRSYHHRHYPILFQEQLRKIKLNMIIYTLK
jgi:hypothetical protein